MKRLVIKRVQFVINIPYATILDNLHIGIVESG